MNYKGILFFFGIYSFLISFLSILNIFYSIYFNFSLDLNSYIITLIISFFIGLLFCFYCRKYSKDININEQILFIVLSFIFLPILISIPYYLSIYNISFLNSYFESVSGLTTTGFSIVKNVENIDPPLLLWRSSSQWLGGLLFLIATIGTIGSRQIKIKPFYLLPGSTSSKNFFSNFYYNFIRIFSIYLLLTIFIIFLLSITNIRLFDSFNLALTTISSGAFIPANSLSTILSNNLQTFCLSISLLFPVLNFYLLFNIFTKKFSFKNHQEDLHIILIIIFITLFLYFAVIPSEGLINIFFAVLSSVSTSGISIYSSNFDLSLLFILLTIISGSLISTSSGLKYIRFYILLKTSYQEIYKIVKPINIFNKTLFNTESRISDDDSKIAFLVFISFIISMFILSSILTFDNLSFENAFKLSILTLTNTATSSLYGLDNLTFFDLNSFTKISLIIFMIIGRIEIVAVLFLIMKTILRK